MKPTNENLRNYAAPALAQWLIYAARRRTYITYGEVKDRLENEIGFDTIFPPTRIGFVAGELMDRILDFQPNLPILNILLVRKDDHMPGEGVGWYISQYLGNKKYKKPGFRENKQEWKTACDKINDAVYAFENWGWIYEQVFGEPPPNLKLETQCSERDGIQYTRSGEGSNHRALRLWVIKNRQRIKGLYANFRAETEVILDSADRVDVVYYGPKMTVVIEVKSNDSNDNDLRRGIFQCIKYRAVMKAMDIRDDAPVEALLVTERRLPSELESLRRRHKIRHFNKDT